MAQSFLSGPNPILMRELRGGLRNVRAFGLIALYIALLGAIVTANFPGNESIDLAAEVEGIQRGRDLFYTIVWGQIALILIIIPALATGALAQERERQTLQPLLLTPLSPLQIVWGKAGGVLSLVGLLLIATIPLTTLCYMLGSVDTGMIIAGYAAILGLAVFTTGFGLYCSARWHSATKALLLCYAFLPIVLGLVLVALPLGASFSGIFCLYLLFIGVVNGWKRGEKSKAAQKLGDAYSKMVYVVAPLVIFAILFLMAYDRSIGLIAVGIGFIFSYFLLATQWGMLQTARELMIRADPEPSARQKMDDMKEEWRKVIAPEPFSVASPQSTPASLSASSFSGYVPGSPTDEVPEKKEENWETIQTEKVVTATETAKTTASKKKSKDATYGKVPFLSDRLNPIYAKEMRSGLLGKFDYLFKFSYGITIASEVFLILALFLGLWNSDFAVNDFNPMFEAWGRIHLIVLLIFAVWFGARAIAPEREGQTLSQLFTIPLPAHQIIKGKMGAVLTFTLYVWVLALPIALLMGMLDLIPFATAIRFVAVELVFGVAAAAWGVFCSFHLETVRKALATSLGGIAAFILAPAAIPYLWDLLLTLKLVASKTGELAITAFLPSTLAFPGRSPYPTNFYAQNYFVFYLMFYCLLAAVLVFITSRNFQRLAREQ
jgi:ABC-type transport system involved in multi-copper enzyme maturation permease subunit